MLLASAALALAGCGGAPGGRLGMDIDLRMQALTGNETLQFVMLMNTDKTGKEVTCPQATVTCVADEQSVLRLVQLDIGGKQVNDYRTPLDLTQAQSTTGQAISVPGIPPGRGYLLVLEVVDSSSAGQQRVGVGCAPVTQILAGTNQALSSPIVVSDTTDGCNPAL